MERTVRMRALMSLKATRGRDAVKRGDEYRATSQEARDDVRVGRGIVVSVMQDAVSATERPVKKAKAGGE